MKTPEIQHQLDTTSLGNEALPLMLGTVSLLDMLESAIPAAPSDNADVLTSPDNDPAVLALLGLISFGRTLRGWLAEVQDQPGDDAERDDAVSAIGDVMR